MSTRALLEDLPHVYGRLEDALHGTRGAEAERVSGGGGNDRPAPLSLQVAEHRHQVLHDLRYACAHLTRWSALTVRALGDDVAGMCAVLLHCLPDMPDTEAEVLHDTLTDLHSRARALTDLPQLRGTLPLGDCVNADGDLWQCGGALFAMLPADRRRQVWLQCRDCGGRWTVTELPDAANVVLPVHVAADLLGVTPRTIQRRAADRDAGVVRLGDALTVPA